jgi:hypothetical protein
VSATNNLIFFQGRKMGKLDAAERKEIPSKDFGLPAERKYPTNDRGHSTAAKSRAKEMLRKGTISQSQYDKICAKADKELAK